MKQILVDSYRRCMCGHIAAHHRADEMTACRMRSCDCEGFMARREPVPEPTSEQLDALRRIGVWPPQGR